MKVPKPIPRYDPTQVAPPEATGGAGFAFEHKIASLLTILMLCEGRLRICPKCRIAKLQFQTRKLGWNLDDMRICLVDETGQESQILLQIKRKVGMTRLGRVFTDTVQAAWLDFQSKDKFSPQKDFLALISGPLARSDEEKFDWLCEWVRTHAIQSCIDEMRSGAGIAYDKRQFYNLIREIIQTQTEEAPNEEEVIAFLRRFYLLRPDSLYEGGLLDAFACSLLRRTFVRCNPDSVFDRLQSFVERIDAIGGECSRESLLKELSPVIEPSAKDEFDAKESVAKESVDGDKTHTVIDAAKLKKDWLALLCLVGGWCDSIDKDCELVASILGCDQTGLDEFVHKLADADLAVVEGGIVRIHKKRILWRYCASSLSTVQIKRYEGIIAEQLSQIDKSLDCSPDKRYLFSDLERGLEVSKVLREGMAHGLALFGACSGMCKRIDSQTRDVLASQVVRKLFHNKDWRIWATIDTLLPALAEAAPAEYMRCVRAFLKRKTGGLKKLYGQERLGLMNRGYVLGLVNSLGCLAWLPECMAEALSMLGEMAKSDPDGQWHPRPIDIFQKVLHPLAPHTWASSQKRLDVLKGLVKHVDSNVSWDIVYGLLPTGMFSYIKEISGPIYRCEGLPREVGANVDEKDVARQFEEICKMAVPLCKTNPERLTCIVRLALEHFPDGAFKVSTEYLRDVRRKLSEEARYAVWKQLRQTLGYVKMSDKEGRKVDWAHFRLLVYKSLEETYTPKDLRFSARHLFSWDADLRKMGGKELEHEQSAAIEGILEKYGVEAVLEFAKHTDGAGDVGFLLGKIGNEQTDAALLPGKLSSNIDDVYYPIVSYVAGRFAQNGWNWVRTVIGAAWATEQIAQFLARLPFQKNTWVAARDFLKTDVGLYWRACSRPYLREQNDLDEAVEGMLLSGCVYKAIDLVGHAVILKNRYNPRLCYKTLKALVNVKVVDSPTSMSSHNIPEVIKAIQKSSEISQEEKAEIEWKFIDFVDWVGHHGIRPVALDSELANSPQFFCEVLQLAFLSGKDAKKPEGKREKRAIDENERRRASNAWKLLYNWKRPPGLGDDGVFNGKQFNAWVRKAAVLAKRLDRVTPFQIILGQTLTYAKSDNKEFWLPFEVANLLCQKNNETMLTHFRIGFFNARGVHWVDKTGKEDEELATQYVHELNRKISAGCSFQVFAKKRDTLYFGGYKPPFDPKSVVGGS